MQFSHLFIELGSWDETANQAIVGGLFCDETQSNALKL